MAGRAWPCVHTSTLCIFLDKMRSLVEFLHLADVSVLWSQITERPFLKQGVHSVQRKGACKFSWFVVQNISIVKVAQKKTFKPVTICWRQQSSAKTLVEAEARRRMPAITLLAIAQTCVGNIALTCVRCQVIIFILLVHSLSMALWHLLSLKCVEYHLFSWVLSKIL